MIKHSPNIALETYRSRILLPAGARILLGVSLAAFVLCGYWDAVQYGEPEVQILVAILAMSIMVLGAMGIIQKQYEIDLLISVLGLLIIVGNILLRSFYGYDSFEGHWFFTPVQIEYVTYAAIALASSRRLHWITGIFAPALVYLLDALLTQSSLWWGYALAATMCGIAGTVIGLVLKRVSARAMEVALAVFLLMIVILTFIERGGFY